MAKSRALCGLDVQKTMVQSIKTDIKVGLTFADIALHTNDDAKRQRNKARARAAYESVARCRKNPHFADDDDIVEFEWRQAELRVALRQLGEYL